MGRVARTKSHQKRDRASRLNRGLVAIVLGLLCLGVSVPVWGQSGRRQEPGKTSKPREGPIADPNRPGTSNRPAKVTDEVDADERFVGVGRADLVGLLVESIDQPFDGVRTLPHAVE